VGDDVPAPGRRLQEHELLDHQGRPMAVLPDGEPIKGLV